MSKKKVASPKTTVGFTVLGGAVGTIVVWIMNLFGLLVPDNVAAAIATIFAALFGWFLPESIRSGSVEEE